MTMTAVCLPSKIGKKEVSCQSVPLQHSSKKNGARYGGTLFNPSTDWVKHERKPTVPLYVDELLDKIV